MAVSLSITTENASTSVAFCLYLREVWTSDRTQRGRLVCRPLKICITRPCPRCVHFHPSLPQVTAMPRSLDSLWHTAVFVARAEVVPNVRRGRTRGFELCRRNRGFVAKVRTAAKLREDQLSAPEAPASSRAFRYGAVLRLMCRSSNRRTAKHNPEARVDSEERVNPGFS